MEDQNKKEDSPGRRGFVRKLVKFAALGGLSALVLGEHPEKAEAGASPAGITPGVVGGFIGVDNNNAVTDDYGVVTGGQWNQAGDGGSTTDKRYATVGGGQANMASNLASTVSGGLDNAASGSYSTVGGGESNEAIDWCSTVGGGYDNTASNQSSTVSGGYGNTASNMYSTVGGGDGNIASGFGAFVGGGGHDGTTYSPNQASGNASTVSGGLGNIASSNWSTVGGGGLNRASEAFSTVAGGGSNRASGMESTVGGGGLNIASGLCSTVPGGYKNDALGLFSFAAGNRAKVGVTHSGAILFADSTEADFNSATMNEFAVRCTGGARFVTAIDGIGSPTTQLTLTPVGNLGIRTTSPLYACDLRTPGSTSAQMHFASTNTDAGGYFVSASDGNFFISGGAAWDGSQWVAKATSAYEFGGGPMGVRLFHDTGLTPGNTFAPTTRLIVKPNGQVGIGTTTPDPTDMLHVAGRVKATGYDTGDIRFANGVRATEEGKGLAFLNDAGEKIAVLDREGNWHIKGDVIKDL